MGLFGSKKEPIGITDLEKIKQEVEHSLQEIKHIYEEKQRLINRRVHYHMQQSPQSQGNHITDSEVEEYDKRMAKVELLFFEHTEPLLREIKRDAKKRL